MLIIYFKILIIYLVLEILGIYSGVGIVALVVIVVVIGVGDKFEITLFKVNDDEVELSVKVNGFLIVKINNNDVKVSI